MKAAFLTLMLELIYTKISIGQPSYQGFTADLRPCAIASVTSAVGLSLSDGC